MINKNDMINRLCRHYQTIIAENVDVRMRELGLSGRALGERMGSDPRVVWHLLNLETAPSLYTMCKLVTALELDDITDLLKH